MNTSGQWGAMVSDTFDIGGASTSRTNGGKLWTMSKIENSFEPLSMEVVSEFELRTNKILPDTYKKFLLRQNGGEPSLDEFTVPGWAGESSAVSRFFAIHNGQLSNLEREIDVYKDRLPGTLIPIANDPGGNIICLGVDGEYFNKIYFWDHDDELNEEGESKMDFSNLYLVADNIEDFLRNLKKEI